MELKEKQKLRKFVAELESIRGRHTELVSVYIPAGYDIIKIIHHLAQEQSTAKNIKSKSNRDNVMSSLERMIRHLRLFKKTPENGLAVFAGNVAEREGQVNIQVWSIEPPEPLQTRLYRCDQYFVLDLLKDMMEHKEVYGLIVIDRRDASVGLLKGTSIKEIASFSSDVPGKTTKGGQCLSRDSVVQIADGDLEKIDRLHNPYVVKSVGFEDGKLFDSPVVDKWDTKKQGYKIITKCPRVEIESSGDHVFFVRDSGIVEKSASELKVGDCLLMPEKIDIKGVLQEIGFKHIRFLNGDFAQFLGYYIGDGNSDTNRLVFYEQNEELACYYRDFFSKLFDLNVRMKFRESKNYYEIRIYDKLLFDFVKREFPEIRKSLDSEVPKKVLKSPDGVVARFLRGLFDAEGYVAPEELSIGMNNKYLVKQLQMLLLRFGIIGSFCEYDNRRNKYSDNFRYTLRITDKASLVSFRDSIGFSFSEKSKKLDLLIGKRSSSTYVRQVFRSGREIRKILEEHGYLKENFKGVSHFFYDRREMSKFVFEKNIMNLVKQDKELYNKLRLFLEYNLIPVKIKDISEVGMVEMSDISVKNENFIANCVLVHNSQQRYARLRDIAAREFYKRVSDAVNDEFLEMKELKGIIVGGPGHTKEEFLDGDYLKTDVRKKVVAVEDLSYTGEFGLQELVDKSKDVLAKEVVAEEKAVLKDFLESLAGNSEKVAYGGEKVRKALDMAAVERLILSDCLDEKKLNEFEKKAEETGAEVKMVSSETREGEQFKALGGIGAILRFVLY